MIVVCDASVVVAFLTDEGDMGTWAVDRLRDARLVAPSLLPFEVTNALRRLERQGLISVDHATQARLDLDGLPMVEWPFADIAPRVWELRANLTAYDASYVAVAEELRAPLLTMDAALAGCPGVRCPVEHPGSTGSAARTLG